MKRYILLAACLMAVSAMAQEKTSGLTAELGFGFSHYGNYPAVSVLSDPTPSYSMVATNEISIGYRNKTNFFYGLTYNMAGGNTAMYEHNENFTNQHILLTLRGYQPLGHRFELAAGVNAGLLIHTNNIDLLGQRENYTRYGYAGSFSLGVNYSLTPKTYVGLTATLPLVNDYFGEKPTLPAPYTVNPKTSTTGFGLMLTVGGRF